MGGPYRGAAGAGRREGAAVSQVAEDDFRKRLTVLTLQINQGAETPGFDLEASHVQRSIAVEALAAVCEYLNGNGWGERLTGPFVKLLVSFENLASGSVDPVFRLDRDKGKPTTSHTILNLRGRAAAVQQLLMDHEHSEAEAASFILRELGAVAVDRLRNLNGPAKAGSPVGPRAIQRWRSDLNSGKPGDEFALDGFAFMTKILQSQSFSDRTDVRSKAKAILRGISIATRDLISPKSA